MLLFLEQAWDARTKLLFVLAVFLSALSIRQFQKINALKIELENKPAVTEHQAIKIVQGPTRTVEKLVAGQLVERVVYRDAVTKETVSSHVEAPACPAVPPAPRWILGAMTDPGMPKESPFLRAGVTLGGRFDLSYLHTLPGYGTNKQGVDLAVRF